MPEPGKTTFVNPEQIQEQPTREISLTDHLNKKLLTSLFKRLDEEDSTVSRILETENTTEDDEWKD